MPLPTSSTEEEEEEEGDKNKTMSFDPWWNQGRARVSRATKELSHKALGSFYECESS